MERATKLKGIDNLRACLDTADSDDWEYGRGAWVRYHTLLSEMGDRLDMPHHLVFGVFAALSPNNDYHGNLRDANRLLEAKVNGKKINEVSVCTYGPNKQKAWSIANGADPRVEIQGLKTRNFYLNIADPLDPNPVTIDGHIFNAWNNRRVRLNGGVKMSDSLYYRIAYDLHVLASDYKELANVLQGIIWFAWKRKHNILTDEQAHFWSRDHLSAGLGFKMEKLT
jgi:hypothetical protein